MSNRRKGVFSVGRQDVPDLSWDIPAPQVPDSEKAPKEVSHSSVEETNTKKAAAAQSGAAPITQVPVRVPTQLYDALQEHLQSARERPSYGQLVTWTCQDHPDQVIAHLLTSTRSPSERTPRGRRRALPTTPMVLRLLEEELATLVALQDRASSVSGASVTRTAVVVAAIQSAVNRGENR